MRDEGIFAGAINDKILQCENNYTMTNTGFLDLKQRSEAEAICRRSRGARYGFYGGFEDAERTVAVFFPDYMDAGDDLCRYFAENEEESPLALLKAVPTQGGRVLTHRDYLGSLLALGIRREKVGDILVSEKEAQIFVLREMADFLLLNYDKAGRTSLGLERISLKDLVRPEPAIRCIHETVASLRLDNLLSAAFGISRAKAAECVRRGLVFVNGVEAAKTDMPLREKDKLVLRGSGKAVLMEIGGRSRKERIYVTIHRYI